MPEEPAFDYIYLDKNAKYKTTKHTRANSGQAKLHGLEQYKYYCCAMVKNGRTSSLTQIINTDFLWSMSHIEWSSKSSNGMHG